MDFIARRVFKSMIDFIPNTLQMFKSTFFDFIFRVAN